MHSTSPSPPPTWAPGQQIPGTPYRVVRPLGQGGMGEVFEVEHTMLGKRAAMKVLARELSDRTDLGVRLRSEARTLARLSHPNLVEVYDLGTASDARIFFTMELLDGWTLRDLLHHQGKLSPNKAVGVIAQALDGLAAAHSTHLVHRDIKPENVFVCRSGVVKLLDFGIAKAIDASTSGITESGMTLGTPWYMSPEQTRAEPVDQRTDVYAAGLVLWEAISGRRAFSGHDYGQIVRAKLERGAPPLDPRLGAPQALAAAIARACSPDPASRFATAEAFAAELRRALGEPVRPLSLPPPGSNTNNAASRGSPTRPERPADPADTLPIEVPPLPTLLIEAPEPIDRDAPTCHGVALVSSGIGPTGTTMLPAVAAQLAATVAEPASESKPPGMMKAQWLPADLHVEEGDSDTSPGAPRTSAIMVLAAFLVPVAVASIVGLFVLRSDPRPLASEPAQPVATQPAASISPAMSASAGSISAERPSQEAASAQSSTTPREIPAASAPPKNPPNTVQSVAVSASTRTTEPAPVPTPPKAAAKKTVRPASGL